jgi:hypothetical protein
VYSMFPPGGDEGSGIVAVLGPEAQHETEREDACPRHLGAQAQHTEQHGGRRQEQVSYSLNKSKGSLKVVGNEN